MKATYADHVHHIVHMKSPEFRIRLNGVINKPHDIAIFPTIYFYASITRGVLEVVVIFLHNRFTDCTHQSHILSDESPPRYGRGSENPMPHIYTLLYSYILQVNI